MARIIIGSWFVRYPLGGNLSCVLQYLTGLQLLGHDVYFVEKSGYPLSCYDPIHNVMTDCCDAGLQIVHELLSRHGLQDRYCYVDAKGQYHGIGREQIEAIFESADLFVEMGTHEAWLDEASHARCRILIDGDPGFSQIWMANRLTAHEQIPSYDYYFTVGRNVGTHVSTAPSAGVQWRPFNHPVNTSLFSFGPPESTGAFTTVMNWQSYSSVEYSGHTYGHKNIEFERFIDLPLRASAALEVAVAGHGIPCQRLEANGWKLRDAHLVTRSFDSFADYIRGSKGEFTVCKNGFVAMRTGWFSDRSAAYLASGRPVVIQDTGLSAHFPCGKGLFAVGSVEEAAEAFDDIEAHYPEHSQAARDIAMEYFDAPKVLRGVLNQIGL